MKQFLFEFVSHGMRIGMLMSFAMFIVKDKLFSEMFEPFNTELNSCQKHIHGHR